MLLKNFYNFIKLFKVLSRNHALMWFEDDNFYIKDTKSSNGTFINNERLSNSGEESLPKVLRSGDILQLGVEIIDSTKKGLKFFLFLINIYFTLVASGCITCMVRLFNERGEETQEKKYAISTNVNDQTQLKYTLIRNDKLFLMDQYMKEALFRENVRFFLIY